MKKLGFVFRSHPHSTAKGREGLDALLATSAYSENIAVFFIGAGVTQLVANQNTDPIYCRNYAPAFKLMALYDIEEIYTCLESTKEHAVSPEQFAIETQCLTKAELNIRLHDCDKLLIF